MQKFIKLVPIEFINELEDVKNLIGSNNVTIKLSVIMIHRYCLK